MRQNKNAARLRGGAAIQLSMGLQRDNILGLQALGALDSFADDPRTFISGFEARLANASLVQEDISLHAAHRFDETISLGEIEPLDLTDDLLCGFP